MAISTKHFITAALLAALVIILPELAFAQNLNGSIGRRMCNIVAVLVGPAGQAVGTAAVVFLGIGAFFGKVNWGLALTVSIGIIAIFAATTIVNSLSSNPWNTADCAALPII